MTTPATRSKTLAYVGMAFAICFCIGPPIGAYFASRPLPASFSAGGHEVNVYATPALLSLVLLVVETIFLAVALPETRGTRIADPQETEKSTANGIQTTTNGVEAKSSAKASVEERLNKLKVLRTAHFQFLAIFSGIEFSLTFLTFDSEFCLRVTLCSLYSSSKLVSLRLEQQAERSPARLYGRDECSAAGRVCSACCVQSRGRCYGPSRCISLHSCPRSFGHYPSPRFARFCPDGHPLPSGCGSLHGLHIRNCLLGRFQYTVWFADLGI